MSMATLRLAALGAGALGIAGLLAGLFAAPAQAARSYWWAWLFWGGLSFGAFAIVNLQGLVGGRWSAVLATPARAALGTLPLAALLFVPACFALRALFAWAAPEFWAEHPSLPHHRAWLQPAGWMGRAALYFAVIGILAWIIRRRPGQGWCALGAVACFLCVNFAAVDWAMSLDPEWYSTIFPVICMVAQFLAALALCAATALLLAPADPPPETLRDVGNLLLAFTVFWAYVTFSQFLIVWSANLPKEITWYAHRRQGGWPVVAAVLGVWQFALPFLLLLSRGLKQRPRVLAGIALSIVAANALHWYWIVAPTWSPQGIAPHWLDGAAFLGLGGLWLAAYLWQLPRPEVPA